MLRVLDELGLVLELAPRSDTTRSGEGGETADLDALVEEHRGR